ncbi:MAG TPA: MaoC/PaaZ C-terminal domain-containing protein [Sporolactobacillaceae bacterium]|nr:MaoC/PaaZ C-terminal domain-containing protein [Sporolactobacillaceae bacterium]
MGSVKSLQVGEALPTVQLAPVSRLDLIKYAGASGDFNPIHTIDEEAAKAGLPGIIAHGMWSMGNLAKLFTGFYEEGFVKDYSVRFKNMVQLGDQLTLKAVLTEVQDHDVYFKVNAENQHGKTVLSGKLIFSLY